MAFGDTNGQNMLAASALSQDKPVQLTINWNNVRAFGGDVGAAWAGKGS
jgi:hypothetical protein